MEAVLEELKRKEEQERRKNAEAQEEERRRRYARAREEARRRRARTEQETKPQPQPKQTAQPRPQQTVKEWRATTEMLLVDYSTMQTFPQPPVRRCVNATCVNVARNLSACSHSVEAAFRELPGLDVKKERLRWHPDRFSSCPEENREAFQKMAQEVFVVLDEMHRRRRGFEAV